MIGIGRIIAQPAINRVQLTIARGLRVGLRVNIGGHEPIDIGRRDAAVLRDALVAIIARQRIVLGRSRNIDDPETRIEGSALIALALADAPIVAIGLRARGFIGADGRLLARRIGGARRQAQRIPIADQLLIGARIDTLHGIVVENTPPCEELHIAARRHHGIDEHVPVGITRVKFSGEGCDIDVASRLRRKTIKRPRAHIIRIAGVDAQKFAQGEGADGAAFGGKRDPGRTNFRIRVGAADETTHGDSRLDVPLRQDGHKATTGVHIACRLDDADRQVTQSPHADHAIPGVSREFTHAPGKRGIGELDIHGPCNSPDRTRRLQIDGAGNDGRIGGAHHNGRGYGVPGNDDPAMIDEVINHDLRGNTQIRGDRCGASKVLDGAIQRDVRFRGNRNLAPILADEIDANPVVGLEHIGGDLQGPDRLIPPDVRILRDTQGPPITFILSAHKDRFTGRCWITDGSTRESGIDRHECAILEPIFPREEHL